MIAPRSRHRILAILLAGAGVLLGACSSSTGVATVSPTVGTGVESFAVASSSAASDSTASDSTASDGGVGADTSADGTDGLQPTANGDNQFDTLNMGVRLVNMFIPHGSTQGVAVDVWAGYGGDSSSKKLLTVPYGQVSAYFAPQVPAGQAAGDAHAPYTVSFFPAGKTGQTDVLGTQNENSSPAQKLTMILGPGDSSSNGGMIQVFVDQLGSSPTGSGFTHPPLPTAPAGKSIVALNALGLADRSGGAGGGASLTMSTGDGKCVPYISDTTSTELHDPTGNVADFTGGTATLFYVFPAGTKARINLVKTDEDVATACRDQPVVPVDLTPAAGAGQRVFVYGATIASAKALVVPLP